MTPSQLTEKYDLYDRSIDRAVLTETGLRLEFDLFHCDDPERDVEGMEYPLAIDVPGGAFVCEPRLVPIEDGTFGEVLSVSRDGSSATLDVGIDAYGSNKHGFMRIAFRDDARLSVTEGEPRTVRE